MRERDQLKPLVDEMRLANKPAYYRRGKIIISQAGPVKKEIINEYLLKSQLKPVHAEPHLVLPTIDPARSRNRSAPVGRVDNSLGKGDYSYYYNNAFAPLFKEVTSAPKPRVRGRGRSTARGRGDVTNPVGRR